MGRMLARNGSVTLDTNTFTQPTCTAASTTTGTTIPGKSNLGGGGGTGTGTTGTTIAGNGLGGGSNVGGLGSGVVPTGFPATGLGGASKSDDPALVALGGLALAAALVASGLAVRRRRVRWAATRPDGDGPGGDA
jgi:hypothetical protein